MFGRSSGSTGDEGAWIELRETILKRDGYRCRNCGSERFLEAHHWLPLPAECASISSGGYRIGGGDYRIVPASGLITLCKICHSALTGSRAMVRIAEGRAWLGASTAEYEWASIFRLWKSNGYALPMRVFRKTWKTEVDHFLLVERIETRKGRHASSAWGRYFREGRADEQKKIRSARAYEWKTIELRNAPR